MRRTLSAAKRCLPATVLRAMQSAESETARKSLLRRSVVLVNAIQSNLWRKSLGEGIMSGHPDMPEFSFDATDVGAIVAYLKSIQQR